MKIYLLCFFLLSCSHAQKTSSSSTQKPNWIIESDLIAEQLSKDLAAIRPEIGSQLGYNEFDSKGLLFDKNTDARDREVLATWVKKIDSLTENKTMDPELKTDLVVLREWLSNQISKTDAYIEANEVDFSQAVNFIFNNLQILLNPQSPSSRKKAAVDRFRLYVRGDSTYKPLLVALQINFREKLKIFRGQKMLLPFKDEVEQYLKDADSIVEGIGALLKTSEREDWTEDFKTFQQQARDYYQFARTEVLTNSRNDSRVPEKIYIQLLKNRGIDSSPQTLIQIAKRDYEKLYKEFQQQARTLAAKYHLKNSKPAAVISFLKSEKITDPTQVERLYRYVDERLDKIIRDQNLATLPQIPLKIRVAGDAESRVSPVPHLSPPPLVNNKGERPEFVVPSSTQGLPFDDFASKHAAIMLSSHEGRPGHDLQYSRMLDQGISVIRGRYAFNAVNVEGWALYAEDLVYPFLQPEEQFFAIQTRLWRIARMFLDPEIQLRKIKDQSVIDVFTKELGVSNIMANLELRRYKFDDIGQAPSYYFGYLQVKQIRDETEKRLGSNYNLKCFNDKLLSYGLLPLKISREKIKEQLNCKIVEK